MSEGFCEMFTAEILDAQIATAGANAALRAEVEGSATTPAPAPASCRRPTPRRSPTRRIAPCREHPHHIGPQAIRAAYFQGHIEYLGLDPGGAPSAPAPAGAADVCGVPAASRRSRSCRPPAACRRPTSRPPTPRSASPARCRRASGCRAAATIASSASPTRGRHHVIETRAQIAEQNGVSEADLVRANPAVADWARLADGDHVLIPRH